MYLHSLISNCKYMKIEYSRPYNQPRTETVTLRLSVEEKALIAILTEVLNKGKYRWNRLSQADLVMFAVKEIDRLNELEKVSVSESQETD